MNLRPLAMLGAFCAIAATGGMSSIAAAQAGEDVQVLTRGPVHEAFAASVNFNPTPGIVVNVAPPAAIEELPPEQQLEGDNVSWISGYWAWDDEQNDFLWISGIWRNLPPGRQWVPGYWSDIGNAQYQWTSGYWADATTSEVTYIPTAPPRNIDAGANIAAPSDDSAWIPGSWFWVETRYVWRPGYWIPQRRDWTWMPSRYCWTPRGYLYVDGYWDYAVASRGVLFAPVYFNRHVYTNVGYCYTPSIVVALNVFSDHLFVRPRCGHYYFGDYYAPHYRDTGFYASFSWHGRDRGYDPIFAYQRWDHRHDRGWEDRRRHDFDYFRDNHHARPPHTWNKMREMHDDRIKDGRNRSFADSLEHVVKKTEPGQQFRSLDKDRRDQLVSKNHEMKKFGMERRQTEAHGRPAGQATKPNEVIREKFAKSPIMGRDPERFATKDAPPKRPEPRADDIHVKPVGPKGRLTEATSNNGIRRPGEGLGIRPLGKENHADQALDRKNPVKDLPKDPQVAGQTIDDGKPQTPGASDARTPGHKGGVRPHDETPMGKKDNADLSLKDRLTKPHDAQPKPQDINMPPRDRKDPPKPQDSTQIQEIPQPKPQVQDIPQRDPQVTPKHKDTPQIREIPQPKPQVQDIPQRDPQVAPKHKETPQIREIPQPKPQVRDIPQIRQPQPQTREIPQPKPQVREIPQPKPQVREIPQIRQPQPQPQMRQPQPQPQMRQPQPQPQMRQPQPQPQMRQPQPQPQMRQPQPQPQMRQPQPQPQMRQPQPQMRQPQPQPQMRQPQPQPQMRQPQPQMRQPQNQPSNPSSSDSDKKKSRFN